MKFPASKNQIGFTLIELMLVILCLFLLLVPAFRILRSGTKSSLKGMMQIGTTLEARNVLRQISQDLKNSCFLIDGNQRRFSYSTLLQTTGNLPNVQYAMLVFPHADDPDAAFEKSGTGRAWRNASMVTYRVGNRPLRPNMRQLVRVEQYHNSHPQFAKFPNGIRETIVSAHVNLLEITPDIISSSGKTLLTFRLHLQLVDFMPGRETPVAVAGTGLVRPREGAIADYFAVVYSEFYRALRSKAKFNPNWQNCVRGPND